MEHNITKIHEFNPVIYPRKLWVVITDSEEFLKDKFDTEVEFLDINKKAAFVFSAVLRETGDYGVVAVFTRRKHMSVKIIAHEAVHVTSTISLDCGMGFGFNVGEDEHFAYLVGWAAECIDKVKRNKL